MPEPVIVHVIGTTVLLGAALLIVASFAIVQSVNYIQALNVMLAEAAESCAREIVELASVHTLGGEEFTYMMLTLPQSLGGQPYNLTLENMGENMIAVKAQLQLHHQVRIVVTPNFGRAPVYAVQEPMRYGELIVSPTILLPTPYGWKAALVAVRSRDSIIIGFAAQSPTLSSSIGSPNFMLVNWSLRLEGLTGSQQDFVFAVWNRGSTGTATVNVYDNVGRLIESTMVTVRSGGIAWGKLTLTLPSEKGSYVWRVECKYGAYLHDSRTFLVVSRQPKIVISSYDSSISGSPRYPVKLNVSVVNVGDYNGTAQIFINSTLKDSYTDLPIGQLVNLTFEVELPATLGSYVWNLSVKTLETGYIDQRQIHVQVRDPNAPYISWINATIDGLINWNAKICVRINNPSQNAYMIDLLLNGTAPSSGATNVPIPAGGFTWINFTSALPSRRGYYKWNLSLVRSNLLLDVKIVDLVVRGLKNSERTAIFHYTFDNGTLPSSWSYKGGDWSVFRNLLQGKDQSNQNKPDGFCSFKEKERVDRCAPVYYWRNSVSHYLTNGLTALVQIRVDPNDKDVYRGFALLDGSLNRLYEVALYVASNKSAPLLVEVFDGTWRTLDSSTSARNLDGWYTLFLRTSYTGYSLVFTYELYDTGSSLLLSKSYSTTGFLPSYIGLLVSKGSGEFDNIVLASGDSRYIMVRGLPSRWKVELYSGTSKIAEGVSSGSTDILFPVMGKPIIASARIVVKDPYGGTKPEWQYDYTILMGGDIIVFSP